MSKSPDLILPGVWIGIHPASCARPLTVLDYVDCDAAQLGGRWLLWLWDKISQTLNCFVHWTAFAEPSSVAEPSFVADAVDYADDGVDCADGKYRCHWPFHLAIRWVVR